jgi:hypothetical protein
MTDSPTKSGFQQKADRTNDVNYVLGKLIQAHNSVKATFDHVKAKEFSDFPEREYHWGEFERLVDTLCMSARYLEHHVRRIKDIEICPPPEFQNSK